MEGAFTLSKLPMPFQCLLNTNKFELAHEKKQLNINYEL